MISILRHGINFYLYSSLHIGLCAVFLYFFSCHRLSLESEWRYATFLFCSTVLTYSLHRIIGMSKVKAFAHKGRYAVIEQFKWHIIVYAAVSAIACIYLFFQFEYFRMVLLVAAGLISVLYTIPIFRGKKRLRDFSSIKIFLIAIVWAFVTESIPLYENGISNWVIIGLFIERALFFIALTLPFDIRDIEVDAANGVKTIPSAVGKNKAIKLSYSILIMAIAFNIGYTMYFDLSILPSFIMVCVYCVTMIVIHYTKEKKEDYYYSGILDGMLLLPYLIYLFAQYLG